VHLRPAPTPTSTSSTSLAAAAGVAGIALTASLSGLGCGRHATEADCRLIVDKSVELQSKEMSETDPAAIADRAQRIRAALEDDMKECQSRRVTDKTMGCIQGATSTKELDACLR
jgi:hypothetical protein